MPRMCVLSGLELKLGNLEARRDFMDAVELRQAQFRANRGNVCILDAYDMFSTHILLRSNHDDRAMAYARVISRRECVAHEVDYPVHPLVKTFPKFELPYARFLANAKEALHMGYLCLDPKYKGELENIKLVDLMIWLGFQESGVPEGDLAFTATPNAKYHQDRWLREIGEWVDESPNFIHPLIPETHQMILIPTIAESYWKSREKLYRGFYTNLKRGLQSSKAA